MLRFIYRIFAVSIFCISLSFANSVEDLLAGLGRIREKVGAIESALAEINSEAKQLEEEILTNSPDLSGGSGENTKKTKAFDKRLSELEGKVAKLKRQLETLQKGMDTKKDDSKDKDDRVDSDRDKKREEKNEESKSESDDVNNDDKDDVEKKPKEADKKHNDDIRKELSELKEVVANFTNTFTELMGRQMKKSEEGSN
jgi:chromosome segregation ATPase